jgi:glycosyl transferase family 25
MQPEQARRTAQRHRSSQARQATISGLSASAEARQLAALAIRSHARQDSACRWGYTFRMLRIEAFVIHLHRQAVRRPLVDTIVEQSPVPTHVVDAVDGQTLDLSCIKAAYRPYLSEPRYPFGLREGEIGCFMSHRACWKRIDQENLHAALIMEDDVDIGDPAFANAFALAQSHLTVDSFIRFPAKRREVSEKHLASFQGTRLFEPRVTGLGMHCQLVGRDVARRLLEVSETFDRPVDAFLQMSWATGVQPVCVYPSGVHERSAQFGGSTIGRRTKLTEKLAREILRFRYRSQILAYARRLRPFAKGLSNSRGAQQIL